MWDLPRSGLEPMSPALAGRFLTTAPPGKPSSHLLWSVSQVLQYSLGKEALFSAGPPMPFLGMCLHFLLELILNTLRGSRLSSLKRGGRFEKRLSHFDTDRVCNCFIFWWVSFTGFLKRSTRNMRAVKPFLIDCFSLRLFYSLWLENNIFSNKSLEMPKCLSVMVK